MATPGKNKTNFKTYEASTRLLAAVIATTNVKLDYAGKRIYFTYVTCTSTAALDSCLPSPTCQHKLPSDPIIPPSIELARYIGGTATKDAIQHRLRPIKQLAKMQAACVKNGEDPGELPVDKGGKHPLNVLSQHVLFRLVFFVLSFCHSPLVVSPGVAV